MAQITKANARELGKRGNEAKARMLEIARAAGAYLAEIPMPKAYEERRHARIRAQLDKLSSRLDCETDPSRIDKLCCAIVRLQELERSFHVDVDPAAAAPAPRSRPGRPNPANVAGAGIKPRSRVAPAQTQPQTHTTQPQPAAAQTTTPTPEPEPSTTPIAQQPKPEQSEGETKQGIS